MKRSLLTLILAIFTIALTSCNTTSSNWNKEQRRTILRALDQYRDMVYIDELSDAEFYIFANEVTEQIELEYPNYEELLSLPAFDDTMDIFITTYIVEQLDADGSNIRHIYPYRTLRREGRVPSGVGRKEQRAFYKCLARKVNAHYDTFEQFFNAVVADTTDTSQIAIFEAECAKSTFGWNGME